MEEKDRLCLHLSEGDYVYNRFVKKSDELLLHCHDYYEIIFLSSNGQRHYVNGDTFELPKNALIFIRPDDYHDLYNEDNDNAVIQHIAFSKPLGQQMFEFLGKDFPSERLLSAKYPAYTILDSIDTKYLENLFNGFNVIQFDDDAAKSVAMRSILVQIFAKFFCVSRRFESDNVPLWLAGTCNAMSRVSNFSAGVERMAEISGKSKEHLCRSIKKYYNLTASEFINDIRLTYIANRLANSDKPIIDLCYESGFSSLGWMYTLFNKKYGQSPAEFRKNQSKGN